MPSGFDPLMLDRLASDLITLLVVLDPVGMVPFFLVATASLTVSERLRTAFYSVIVSFVVLTAFLYVGRYLLVYMQIGLPAFRIAGAFILFLFALKMIFSGFHQEAPAEVPRGPLDIAVFPLAMPGIAGPGAMLAVVLLTEVRHASLFDQSITVGLLIVAHVIVLLALLVATRIQQVLGRAGVMVVTQFMGLILAAYSVQQVIDGSAAALSATGR